MKAKPKKRPAANDGVAVDASGGPAVDPTANVIALNEAVNQRQDDLRELNNAYLEAKIVGSNDKSELRADHNKQIALLRAEHAREIRELESNRLNAIRQVDVTAVNTAADRAGAAIQALAVTTAANAENLRNALNSTAATIAAQTSNTVTAITERISALEKSSYEGKGKQALADPMMTELITEMKSLRESRASGAGKSEGVSTSMAILVAVVTIILALTGLVISGRQSAPAPAPAPASQSVIYVPVPSGTALPTTSPGVIPR